LRELNSGEKRPNKVFIKDPECRVVLSILSYMTIYINFSFNIPFGERNEWIEQVALCDAKRGVFQIFTGINPGDKRPQDIYVIYLSIGYIT
jgi:hypothetical protein